MSETDRIKKVARETRCSVSETDRIRKCSPPSSHHPHRCVPHRTAEGRSLKQRCSGGVTIAPSLPENPETSQEIPNGRLKFPAHPGPTLTLLFYGKSQDFPLPPVRWMLHGLLWSKCLLKLSLPRVRIRRLSENSTTKCPSTKTLAVFLVAEMLVEWHYTIRKDKLPSSLEAMAGLLRYASVIVSNFFGMKQGTLRHDSTLVPPLKPCPVGCTLVRPT